MLLAIFKAARSTENACREKRLANKKVVLGEWWNGQGLHSDKQISKKKGPQII